MYIYIYIYIHIHTYHTCECVMSNIRMRVAHMHETCPKHKYIFYGSFASDLAKLIAGDCEIVHDSCPKYG